ncbi:hypothetical protein EX30DRAFT_372158 [Ascodesmis nigricans]|uniref:Uncharacterized protein n=1 Tax=Ascodesmis nigricans TaxID=341454 RepID=A0A4S2MV79_9PEZI|nr:hypothetical protein EX30DRAFT_372158 [Ascodesmis nigricans]
MSDAGSPDDPEVEGLEDMDWSSRNTAADADYRPPPLPSSNSPPPPPPPPTTSPPPPPATISPTFTDSAWWGGLSRRAAIGLWPFSRRRKRTSSQASRAAEKQPATAPSIREFQVLRKSSIARYAPSRTSSFRRRRAISDRRDSNNLLSYASSGVLVPDHLHRPKGSSDTGRRDFTPQKQPHESGGFASYFSEGEENSIRPSVDSCREQIRHPQLEQPHLPTPPRRSTSLRVSGVIRKLSKRRKDSGPLNSVYNPHLARYTSQSNRFPYADPRSHSAPSGPHRTSIHSVESHRSSGGAYRIRSFAVLAPRPKLVYEERTSPTWPHPRNFSPALIPSRTASRRTTSRGDAWRYNAPPLMSEENLPHREDRINDLAMEMDEHGLREAMERDARRRERKRIEAEERAQRKLERRLAAEQQRRAESERYDQQDYVMRDVGHGETSVQGYLAGALNTHPTSELGNQTPLSWFNDNQSVEQIHKTLPDHQSRQGMITPVSMDSDESPFHYDDANSRPTTAIYEPNTIIEEEGEEDTRPKASTWTTFIRRATAARIRKGQESRTVNANESNLLPDSDDEAEGEKFANERAAEGGNRWVQHDDSARTRHNTNNMDKTFLSVDDLRHREGQTPGRHVSTEILAAMTALETGQLHQRHRQYSPHHDLNQYDADESELRDTLPPSISPAAADSRASSRISFDTPHHPHHHPNGILRSASQQSYSRRSVKSAMSTSLASIDSEGSWLSGRIISSSPPSRASMHTVTRTVTPVHRSPVSSPRLGYDQDDEIDDDVLDDDMRDRSIIESPTPSDSDPEQDQDRDIGGGARLDLDDSNDEEEQVEDVMKKASQARGLWREGVGKQVHLETPPVLLRAQSSIGMLNNDSDSENETKQGGNPSGGLLVEDDDEDGNTIKLQHSDSTISGAGKNMNPVETPIPSSTFTTPAEEYQTPLETPLKPFPFPFDHVSSELQTPAEEYKTPMEEPVRKLERQWSENK